MSGLSVVLVTAAPAARLEWWFGRVRAYADEVVVGVDAAAAPSTVAAAERLADVVRRVELPGFADPARDWLTGFATGDWVLQLDDDEALPTGCAPALRALLADDRWASYGLPFRWVVRGPDGGQAWLRQHPWHTCHYTRLWRHDPARAGIPGALHTAPMVAGPSRALDPDGPLAVYHLDLLWADRAAREAKVARYRRTAGGDRPTGEEFYLWEEYADTLLWQALPPGEAFPAVAPTGDGPAADRAPGAGGGGAVTDLPALRAHLAGRGLPSDTEWRDGWAGAALGDGAPDPLQWSATYRLAAPFEATTTNRGDVVRVAVTNTSGATWASSGAPAGRVALASRWRSEGWGAEVAMGDTTRLPGPVAPGEQVEVELGVWTPRLAGDYELVVDLVHEGHSWWSQHGVAPLRVPVTVEAGTAPPGVRHFVGRAADDPPAPTGPSATVPVAPVRLVDSQVGQWLIDGPIGPLAAGRPLVLRVAGHAGVPDDATGVVLGLAVSSADDGVVSLWPTDGAVDRDVPVFTVVGGRRSVGTVTVGLGRARGHGRVTLVPSVGCHLTLDLLGYLVGVAT
ncbi:MAG TPA: hypothetical protein VFP61_06445 [Acidimicrobiales bacterium]|nr:hypothetical protein [Acidimicrobiales bacterium]